MREAVQISLRGEALSRAQAREAMRSILNHEARPEQIGAYLASLHFRAPHVDEIVGFVEALREVAISVTNPFPRAIDTCGTGGDGLQTFNVSTAAAFVAASGGAVVAKHGNRAVSSRCGSFDVLEALRVPLAQDPDEASNSLRDHGLSFFFAPVFHPALGALSALRRALGVRTLFNALGPLLNPAGVRRQLIGVYNPVLLDPVVEALHELGADEALVVCGADGMDEISLHGPTEARHLRHGHIEKMRILPEDLGLFRASPGAVSGGDAHENAELIERIFNGDERGAPRDLVLLNAAGALLVAGLAEDLADGLDQAAETLKSGATMALLEKVRGGLS